MAESVKPKRPQDPVLDKLAATFPIFAEAKPLAIGVHKVILERLPELTKDLVSKALKRHTATTRYLKAVAKGGQRFDLDGNAAGEITDEQRDAAAKLVNDRQQRAADKRKAEEAQRREEAKTKQRQEKLQQLADKFSKH